MSGGAAAACDGAGRIDRDVHALVDSQRHGTIRNGKWLTPKTACSA